MALHCGVLDHVRRQTFLGVEGFGVASCPPEVVGRDPEAVPGREEIDAATMYSKQSSSTDPTHAQTAALAS
jgi:hypothetical protein